MQDYLHLYLQSKEMIQFDAQTAKLQTIPICLFDLQLIGILARDRALAQKQMQKSREWRQLGVYCP
jgi:hypothetical protein